MSGEPGLPQPGDVVAGKYRVERGLGTGGMGAVFAATHTLTGQAVALKWLQPRLASEPRAVERFIREARAAARIRHPNVIDIYGVEEQDGRAFLVFELLEGETLREVLRRGALGVGECLALLIPAMRGVAAAHAQGIVHRDIKPENLFLTRDPDHAERRTPKVLDFGISKLAADSPAAEGALTATGATLGTPHYMSLEQLQGAEVDQRTDVYAFGVVLYECLTGRRPFESENFSAIVVKAATETPADACSVRPELPRALSDVVRKAMARAREERYPSLRALIDALSPFAAVESGTRAELAPAAFDAHTADTRMAPTRASPKAGAPRAQGRGSRVVAVAGGLLLSSAAALWLLGTRPRGPLAQPPSTAAATAAQPKASRPLTPEAGAAASAMHGPAQPRPEKGADIPASPRRPATAARFASGWVYLGEFEDGRWITRYFDGWGAGLPALGAKVSARGRSYVREAIPDENGELARVRTTIGSAQPVAILELSRWQGQGFIWARAEPAW